MAFWCPSRNANYRLNAKIIFKFTTMEWIDCIPSITQYQSWIHTIFLSIALKAPYSSAQFYKHIFCDLMRPSTFPQTLTDTFIWPHHFLLDIFWVAITLHAIETVMNKLFLYWVRSCGEYIKNWRNSALFIC